jgi:hypothetical protein
VQALMKASPYITAHYSSGIHAFNTAWTVLHTILGQRIHFSYKSSYEIFVRRSHHTCSIFYSQYNQRVVGILTSPQVGHYLRAAFGLHHRREGQTLSVDYGFLPSYLSDECVVTEIEGRLYRKVSFHRK